MMLDPHSLQILEFSKILSFVSDRCLTPFGHEEIAQVAPLFSKDEIDRHQDENAQMRDILTFGQPFPITNFGDCRPLLERATIEDAFLEPAELIVLCDLVRLSSDLHKFESKDRAKMPALDPYLSDLKPCADLKDKIISAIDERGEIKDNASPQLKKIRQSISAARGRLISRLEKIVAGKKRRRGWQDDVVTQRNGRYVIPVLAEQYNREMGILHDRSQSGSTLFVEPNEAVDLNNQLNLLYQDERQEIDRILRHLTSLVAERYEPLTENCRIIGRLDAIHAIAGMAVALKCTRPKISEESILRLMDARHPLLICKAGSLNGVVPLDISISSDRQGLLITGPNTGGKTVALKTCGLLLLMAQSGLPIPANEKSEVGIFQKLYADIGDEQSIEQSLSTFSSHLRNVIVATTNADENTLVLLDEVGAGTDPKEGAALAEAVIVHLLEKGAKIMVTTHYAQLKTLPLEHEGLENASMEFDRSSLTPTFHLQIGIPGSSFAVEIAERLGMDSELCNRASSLLGSGERSLNELISSLEAELSQIRTDRTELTERLSRARKLESFYEARKSDLDESFNEEKEKALKETKDAVDTTRKEVENLVGEIRKTQASQKAIKDWHTFMREAQSKIDNGLQEVSKNNSPSGDYQTFDVGELVRVISLNQEGEIEELLSDNRARIKVGSMNMVADFRNLEKLNGSAMPKQSPKPVNISMEDELSPEIHLRGMTVEEALESLERYLDKAVIAGLCQVYVIHGKGTGTLRRTLSEYLRKHREVDSLQLGNWNEGGAGVTVVKLKS